MKTLHPMVAVWGLLLVSLAAHPAWADVLNMGGTRNADGSWTGFASLETVPVGNPGNAADIYTGYGALAYTYQIGKYEVTAGQYCHFLNAVAKTDTYGLYSPYMDYNANLASQGCNIQRTGTSGSYSYSVAPDWANRPVNRVSWGDAARFVNWLTNGQPTGPQGPGTTEDGSYCLNGAISDLALTAITRKAGARYVIPSEDEWYKAAYYDPAKQGSERYWINPTPSGYAPGRDMSEATKPGNNANYYHDQLGYTIGSPYFRTPVGEFELSASPYGTFDQGGNVWEIDEGVVQPGARNIRGGSYWSGLSGMSAGNRFYGNASLELSDRGFRVALVPEPATLSLLGLGGLLIARRRRG